MNNEIKALQQENERLKEWKEDLIEGNIKLENIRKEAIELIDLKIIRFFHEDDYNLGIEDLKDIKNILQNGSEEK